MRRLIAFWFLSAICFAGKSLVVTPSLTAQNTSVHLQNFSNNQSWRVEFQMHDWTLPAQGNFGAIILELNGVGLQAVLYPNSTVALGDLRDSVVPAQPCQLSLNGKTNVLVRVQRDAVQKSLTCELWNYDGSGYINAFETLPVFNQWGFDGGFLGNGATTNLGFLRVFNTLVPAGSRPPTTADAGNVMELKFDGNLNDSSGHGNSASVPGATYVNTPNQVPIALPKTLGAPTWSNWTSLRAGHPVQLDGSASFSLADASSAVSYFWQQLSGPTTVNWANRTAATPTLTGLIFGTYTFQLTVKDSAGTTASSTLQAAAAAYDDNGVVIPSDPKITTIFGPIIAFGQSPWGYFDERSLKAVLLQNASFQAQGLASPVWATSGQGTVTYPFSGKGPGPGQSCTSLTSAITATSTTLAVADASCLSLSTLPTIILVGSNFTPFGGTAQEMVRICSASATSGPATLTVCYDGRGIPSAQGYNAFANSAQAWASGTLVGEFKIAGAGTKFITDPNRPLCPAGAPGPPGAVVYSAGTVQLAGGSVNVTGVGTNWTTPNHVFGGNSLMIRINATHGGGAPFVAVASISTVSGPTSLTLSRPVPADVDASATFTYTISGPRYVSLEMQDPSGTTIRMLHNLEWCESETAAYAIAAHDIPVFDGTTISSAHYSYKDSLGAQSAFGPNFYGSGLAARAFYFRSGWDFAKQTADLMDEQWVNDPELCNGWCGGIPLLQGGGVDGAIADVATNPTTHLTWGSVRQFGTGVTFLSTAGCNVADTRDSGLQEGYVALLAILDPDPTYHAQWQTMLRNLYNRDNNTINPITGHPCKGADGSWSNGFLWAASGPALNLTLGSAVVAVPHGDATPSVCNGIASGTATITKGNATVLATSGTFVAGAQIIVTGTMKGASYTLRSDFQLNSGGSITMAGLWPGDTGPVTWIIASDVNWGTIAKSNDDPHLLSNWSCVYNNPTQITLNRPWPYPTDTSAQNHMYSINLSGYGQQAFMLGGYKESALRWGSLNPDPSIASGFAALTPLAAQWVHDVGFDPQSLGMNYGRAYESCEPFVSTSGAGLPYKVEGCQTGSDPASIRSARVLNAETTNAISIYYNTHPGPQALNFGDTVFGAVWGYCPYTKPGYYCDSNYVRDENSDVSLGSYKWPGFFFGVGMGHQWPAVRAGSGMPPRPRSVEVSFNLGSAASARIVVTAPTGVTSTFACSGSPCAVMVDDNQGRYLYRIQYLSSAGSMLSQTDPDLLPAAP